MVCTHCGAVAEPSANRCVVCDSEIPQVDGTRADLGASEADIATRAGVTASHATASTTGRGAAVLQPGQKFGARYTIIKQVGEGGMGAVYQAWDESLGIPVALKLIKMDADAHPSEVRQIEARFKRELLLARQIAHPNVVRIHDLGELGPTKYLTMAYVQGADLATTLRRDGRFPVARALAIAKQIAAGLAAAHDVGVVHRDLKPANVLLDSEDHALLTDFGIARSVDAATLHTMPGAVLGTLDYMAPEQARGETADRRADVYSLGLILYEMLAGGRPRASREGGLSDLIARIESGPPPLSAVVSDLPADVQQIVARCLDKDPAARYQSAGELLADLNRLAPDGRFVPGVVSRRFPLRVAAAAALGALVLVSATWWLASDRWAPVAEASREPVSVLIADFHNGPADPVFEGALEQALAIAMEGASFITTYPRRAAADLAKELKPGATLDASAAQLVATREGIAIVLAGSIRQQGSGYRLEVEALKPGETAPVASAAVSAADKGKVLEAIGGLAAAIRKELGDTEPARDLEKETFSAGSLEAVRAYTIAQDLTTDRKNEEAIEYYRQAIAADPNFGRAYAGWAVSAFDLGRRAEAEERWNQALSLMDRMTEREKYRTLGAYYIGIARNFEKAIESYRTLVDQYPADLAGHNNLAVAYFYTLDFAKALEHGQRAIDIYPSSLKFRNNFALYAMYAGDFVKAAESARQVISRDAAYDAAYLPLAMASLAEGDVDAASATYDKARATGAAGASLAAIGLADIALYEGRFADAVALLEPAIIADQQARNGHGAATKSLALAEARLALGDAAGALRAVGELLREGRDEFLAVPGARVLAEARQGVRIPQLARELDARGQPQPRAYAQIISGESALRQRRFSDAIEAFAAAVKSADVWLARFDLGVAYVEAGRFAEAISELESCVKRRGEATALFLDDVPTWRYTAVLPYWLGRAQEGLKMRTAAVASYEQFLGLRSRADRDPVAADARRRLEALRQASPLP